VTGFNLSDWAIRHRALVGFFHRRRRVDGRVRLPTSRSGGRSAVHLQGDGGPRRCGRARRPQDVEQQVTDRIEKKLQEAPHVDHGWSAIRALSESVVLFMSPRIPRRRSVIPEVFYQVRKKDWRHPPEPVAAQCGGAVFQRRVRRCLRQHLRAGVGRIERRRPQSSTPIGVRDAGCCGSSQVAKVDLFGEQDEKIYLDIANAKLATLGPGSQRRASSVGAPECGRPGQVFSKPPASGFICGPAARFDTVADVREYGDPGRWAGVCASAIMAEVRRGYRSSRPRPGCAPAASAGHRHRGGDDASAATSSSWANDLRAEIAALAESGCRWAWTCGKWPASRRWWSGRSAIS
jgi:multidrug efflux pump